MRYKIGVEHISARFKKLLFFIFNVSLSLFGPFNASLARAHVRWDDDDDDILRDGAMVLLTIGQELLVRLSDLLVAHQPRPMKSSLRGWFMQKKKSTIPNLR